jgi:16S rRNA (uracil1498-N3)-methyltransferase
VRRADAGPAPSRAPNPRIHVADAIAAQVEMRLADAPSRHVQVLRLQPGDALTLFDGNGGEWRATIVRIGRHSVDIVPEHHEPIERELPRRITLALGMPANDRMDDLVEKAVELGVAAIQPLLCERSVLRLTGERAQKRTAHWQAIAVAACEQSGRNRVPAVAPPQHLADWLSDGLVGDPGSTTERVLLSLAADATALSAWAAATWAKTVAPHADCVVLSGPEGGLSDAEIAQATAQRFAPVSLGKRVLRADTAPLAALAWLGLAGA